MSHITNMIIYMHGGEFGAIAQLNRWCAEHDGNEQQFQELDTDAAGGRKVFADRVWAMAGNYFPYEQLADVFATFGWRYPKDAVLIIAHQDAEAVRIVRAQEPEADAEPQWGPTR